ncbi:hypothetical protein DACRYDRAFT_100502 [Dacryopinax primogenitus]|uniref:Glyoxalase-like domain-containing protein n=1 Tax=Dacryopinax primogenitus (strain DJM 731) TaxID=1858805 RepID=M5FWU6_DACPD|nr:uncharacterized protein DACRYDRAFT_100502 [Dacryopinax primogenitus]EJU00884.1 hypothetical protein DACRYDRAFT_100502 [Dacryopinax primogenitus]
MPTLDHIILLVPSLSEAIAEFFSYGFNLVRGGTHSDGLTENALFILSDGTYIECIAFVPPAEDESSDRTAQREAHWWWRKEPGFIDWCLGPGVMESGVIVKTINNASVGLQYDEPVQGGRRTAQGQQINWLVSSPNVAICGPRGRLPFFCQDVPKDSRYLRVPHRSANTNTTLERITILVRPSRLAVYLSHITAVFQACNAESLPSEDPLLYEYRVYTPGAQGTVQITIRSPMTLSEQEWASVHGDGMYECVLKVNRRLGEACEIQQARFAFEYDD